MAFCNRSTLGIGDGFLQSVNFKDWCWLLAIGQLKGSVLAFCNRSTLGIGAGFLQSVNFRDRWWLFAIGKLLQPVMEFWDIRILRPVGAGLLQIL